jgi:hypothetical protein
MPFLDFRFRLPGSNVLEPNKAPVKRRLKWIIKNPINPEYYHSMKKLLLSLTLGLFFSSALHSQCAQNCTLYTQTSIAYSLGPTAGNNMVLGDDQVSSAVPIGFTFTFFCNAYTSLYIVSNGFISFNPAVSQGCCSGGFIPTAGGNPNEFVAFVWTDLYPPGGGTITYTTVGSAPNRCFIVSYNNIPYYPGSGAVSGQIRLYETSNIIEIHSTSASVDSHIKTQGIMNNPGSLGSATPGRNSTTFSILSPDGYRFQPSGGAVAPGPILGPASICIGSSYVYSVTAVAGATSYAWTLPGGWTGSSSTNSITATPGATGVLTVSANYTCGASPNTTLNVTVNPNPTVSITGGTTAVCPGQTVGLTGSGASTYTWNPGGPGTSIVVTPTATTNYTVVGTSVAGCTAQAVQQVTALPAPTVNITGGLSICQGGSVFLTASGANTYTWNTGATSPNISASPPTNTVFSVTGLLGGCTSTAAVTVTVNPNPNISIAGTNTSCAGSTINLIATGGNTYTWSTGALTSAMADAPTQNTVYTVVGTNTATGCSSQASWTVTVNSIPQVTVTGPTAMCINQTITLNAFGATSYSWSNGSTNQSIVVSPTSNISYTVTGTSTLGCQSNPTIKNITVNTLPLVGINPPSQSICRGEAILLTANGANTYSWSPGGALTVTISVTPTATTVYNVVGTNTTTGCQASQNCTITVSLCTGINQQSAGTDEIVVMPNPSSGEFTVKWSNGLNKNVQVFDMMGRNVLQIKSDEDNIFVDITSFAAGIYYVKVQSETGSKVIKIIKE